jgi:hypothetical protein
MRGLGLTLSQFNALPGWEQRLYEKCALYEDERMAEISRSALDFIATIWCGKPEETTEEQPVIEKTTRLPGGGSVRVKTVEDFDFDNKRKKLLAEQDKIRAETKDLLTKMKAELLGEKGG